MKRWNQRTGIALAACFLSCTFALAGKPDKTGGGNGGGGGDSEPTLEGKIFFGYQNQVWTMNADGGNKTPIASDDSLFGFPSRITHAGSDWFLEVEIDAQLPIEFYPDFEGDENGDPVLDENGDPVVKDGAERREIMAVSELGVVVPLTNQPDLEVLSAPVWGIDDEYVSWVARRWDSDPSSPTFGTVLEGGLYVATLEFDSSGNIVGLQQQPDAPLVLLPLVPSSVMRNSEKLTLAPDINDHSWSPDGTQFVFDVHSAAELWICDLLAPPEETCRLLTDQLAGTNLIRPRWSPAGDKVLYEDVSWTGAIMAINVDGTGRTTVANGSSRRPVFLPFWSPTGTHLLYQEGDYRLGESNIIRSEVTGASPTKLTRDIFGEGNLRTALGWRQR